MGSEWNMQPFAQVSAANCRRYREDAMELLRRIRDRWATRTGRTLDGPELTRIVEAGRSR